MLIALDYLSSEGVIHRDVKPQNIFDMTGSSSQPGYRFQLDDFGLCNEATIAVSTSGSPPFMAPEVSENNTLQTPKTSKAIAKNGFRPPQENLDAILRVAETEKMCDIKEMARLRPDERAFAAQMLSKLYDGDGLTTCENQI
ncbi:hypothetical protein J3459_008308 [Metarhizium acridum]|nr:hypothetical protein J3459_008308 [Metarhizium acridum]